MGLNTVSQIATAIDTPLASNIIPMSPGASASYIYGSAIEQGIELTAADYGAVNAFRVVEGGLGADGAVATASEFLITYPIVEDGVVTGMGTMKMPATSTNVGAVKEGALASQVPIGTVAAGIAIGAGIGIKEAINHKQFWNDIVSIGDGINSPTDTINVITRMLQDGSIQTYCDKRTADRIIERLYQFEAFNVIDKIEPEVITPGQHIINLSGMDPAYLSYAASQCGYSSHLLNALANTAIMRYARANAMTCGVSPNGYDRFSITMSFYLLEDGASYNVVGNTQQGLTLYLPGTQSSNKIGTVTASFYKDTGEYYIEPRFSDGYAGEYPVVAQSPITTAAQGKSINVSNIGGRYVPKNQHVTYNGTDLLPPADISQFWNTFSEWLSNGFTQPGYNPLNNTITPLEWIPFTLPSINWQVDPSTGVQPDIWTGIYPEVNPYPEPIPGADPEPIPYPWLWPSFKPDPAPKIDPERPDPYPTDDNPEPVPNPPLGDITPIGIIDPTSAIDSANALYTVYNPTQAQVNALGSYLWTSNIIELISQFFQNPLDAIISLHMVYVTPETGPSQNIKLGYLDSGVSAAKVISQYKTIECGDVEVPEVYHNALDYDGVNVMIFLPFIGFRQLKAKEVVGARIRVSYKVDVYTGTCLALLYVIRPNASQLLYSFEGDCSVQIPLTAADRTRLISGLVSAGLGAATGNPVALIGGIASMGANIERSGSFSGNAGAMGVKKPYLVITRAKSAQSQFYNTEYGYPNDKYAPLFTFKGYTRCKSVHVNIDRATDVEKNRIESILKRGIYV